MEKVKTTKWYALKVTANQERKVKEYLEKEIKIYNLSDWILQVVVPTEKVMSFNKQTGKKNVREKLVMPGYLFVNADLNNGEIGPILENVPGVYGFLSMKEGKVSKIPQPIKDREVERFLDIKEDIDDNIVWNKFEVGEHVKILEGPFSTFQGVVESVDTSKNKLNVMVSIFQRQTPVEVLFTQVEKVAEKK
jgi:transcriptional antiterminator NusG